MVHAKDLLQHMINCPSQPPNTLLRWAMPEGLPESLQALDSENSQVPFI